jgi:hypothetical protein
MRDVEARTLYSQGMWRQCISCTLTKYRVFILSDICPLLLPVGSHTVNVSRSNDQPHARRHSDDEWRAIFVRLNKCSEVQLLNEPIPDN